MNAIGDIGRYGGFGGGIASGRLLDDVDQQSPLELQRTGLDQTRRLIDGAAGPGDGFNVLRGSGGDFLKLGTRQTFAGVPPHSTGNDVLDEITGTVGKLQAQLDQQVNAASQIDPSNQAALQQAMFKVQMLQSQIQELVTAATDILKTLHETQMSIIRSLVSN